MGGMDGGETLSEGRFGATELTALTSLQLCPSSTTDRNSSFRKAVADKDDEGGEATGDEESDFGHGSLFREARRRAPSDRIEGTQTPTKMPFSRPLVSSPAAK